MKAELTSENHRDFHQRHAGTFGFLGPERRLVRVDGVNNRRVDFTDADGGDYHAVVNSGIQFEFIPVSRGWINGGDGETYFFNRHPARQWQRGISHANTTCFSLNTNLKTATTRLTARDVNWDVLTPCFTHPVEGNTAVRAFKEGQRPTVALGTHFALSQNSVWFCDRKVATIEKNKVLLTEPLVLQELQDMFKFFNFSYEVVLNDN